MENKEINELNDLFLKVQKGGSDARDATNMIMSSARKQKEQLNNLSIALKENQEQLDKANKKMVDMDLRIKYLEELLDLRSYEMFMKKREDDAKIGQMSIYDFFDDLEANQRIVQIEEEIKAESEKLAPSPKEKRKRAKTFINDDSKLPSNIPTRVKDIKFDEERIKKEGLEDIHSDIVRKYLHRIPSKYEIIEEHIHQYRKGTGADSVILRPEKENDRFGGKSPIDGSVVADIIVQKYLMGMPLFRQEALMRDEGIVFPRATMVNCLTRALPALLPVATS